MRRIAAFSLLFALLSCNSLQAATTAKPAAKQPASKTVKQSVPDPWKKHIDFEFKNTALPEVFSALFKGTGVNYVLNPALNQARVTARLQNITRQVALEQITAAAGASYRYDGKLVVVSPAASIGTGQDDRAPSTRWSKDAEVRSFLLSNVDTATVLPVLSGVEGIQVLSSTGTAVVVKGDRAALDELDATLKLVDSPNALLRTIKIMLKAEITAGGIQKNPMRFTTLSMGVEGEAQPLEIRVGQSGTQPPLDMSMSVSLTPTVVYGMAQTALSGPDVGNRTNASISLVGEGTIVGRLPMELSKPFRVAASVVPGQETEIAAGSAELGNDSLQFRITAVATIEGSIKPSRNIRPDALIEADGALKEAELNLEQAMTTLEATKRRYDAGLVPMSELTSALFAVRMVEIKLSTAQQRLDALKNAQTACGSICN